MATTTTLDYAFAGQPFVTVVPAGVNTGTLDYAFRGKPFYAEPSTISGTLAWTEANDATAITATIQHNATLAWTESNDACALAGLVIAPRYARPQADTAAGSWLPSSGASLAAMLNEATQDDASYIYTNSASTCQITLGAVADPFTSVNQTVRYSCWSGTGNGLTVQLKQGAAVIAEWTHASLPTTSTLYERNLTGAQCDAITDYTGLRLAFAAA